MIKDKLINCVVSVWLLMTVVMGCSDDTILPAPPPPPPPVEVIDTLIITPVVRTMGFSEIPDRLGGGDYLCDTLFWVSNLPDGEWNYSLSLESEAVNGIMTVKNKAGKLPNKFKVDYWNLWRENDTLSFNLRLYCDEYVMNEYNGDFKVVHEPCNIRSWQDLQAMRYDLAGNYRLENDIVFPEPATSGFPEQGFEPIGSSGPSSAFLLNAFRGTLDGYGYRIVNFSIDRSNLNYVGLFGVIADATIKDLYLEISAHVIKGGNYVGAIAGYVARKSVIENCKVTGSVEGLEQVGGVAGILDTHGRVELCRTTGSVTGINYVGGIVGQAGIGSVAITNFVEGVVEGNNYVGGIAGFGAGKIGNSQTGGDIKSISVKGVNFSGGIAGYNNGLISGCRTINGIIEGGDNAGGLVGATGTLSECYESCSKVTVKGVSYVGGVVGANKGLISNCYVIGKVDGQKLVGGMAGELGSEVSNCYVAVSVTGQSTASSGIFAGVKNGTTVSCYYDNGKGGSSKAVGTGSDFGIESRLSSDFIGFAATQIPRKIFVGWDFRSIWENEVPLANNDKFPGLKTEFNFE